MRGVYAAPDIQEFAGVMGRKAAGCEGTSAEPQKQQMSVKCTGEYQMCKHLHILLGLVY